MHKVKIGTELQVITPNEPGILGRVLGTLANAGVNLKALCSYSEDDKGKFFLVASDNNKAEKSLKLLGYKVKMNKVVLIQVEDHIGAGAEIGALLGNANIDVKYCYGTSSSSGITLLVFNTNNNKKTIETLS